MNSSFNHKFVFINTDGRCSDFIDGIIRQDESAAIIPPKYKEVLKEAYVLRHYVTSLDSKDYLIKDYYNDTKRPLSKLLVRPIVIVLAKSV